MDRRIFTVHTVCSSQTVVADFRGCHGSGWEAMFAAYAAAS